MSPQQLKLNEYEKIYEGKTEKDNKGNFVFDENTLNEMMHNGTLGFLYKATTFAHKRFSHTVATQKVVKKELAYILKTFNWDLRKKVEKNEGNSPILFSSKAYVLDYADSFFETEEKIETVGYVTTVFKAEINSEDCIIYASLSTISSEGLFTRSSKPNIPAKLASYQKKGLDHDSLSHFQNCKVPPLTLENADTGTCVNNSIRLAFWCHANRQHFMEKISLRGGKVEDCKSRGQESKKRSQKGLNYFKMRLLKLKGNSLKYYRKYTIFPRRIQNWLSKCCLFFLKSIHALTKNGSMKLLVGLLYCWFSYVPRFGRVSRKILESGL